MSILYSVFESMIAAPFEAWARGLSGDYRDDPVYKRSSKNSSNETRCSKNNETAQTKTDDGVLRALASIVE